MSKRINFFSETHCNDFIDVDNLGNCSFVGHYDALKAYYEYIIIVDTKDGFTRMLQAGPYVLDEDKLPMSTHVDFFQFEFKEGVIKDHIEKFAKSFTQLEIVDKETALSKLRSLEQYMRSSIY